MSSSLVTLYEHCYFFFSTTTGKIFQGTKPGLPGTYKIDPEQLAELVKGL